MNDQPSTLEQEVTSMEHSQSAYIVKKLKEIKKQNELTFPRIIDMMEAANKTVSLSTLRRVFADGCDSASFSYEHTLLPIWEVLQQVDEGQTVTDSPHAKEIEALKAVIHCQNEELASLHESKQLLESRVTFLLEQIALKDRRMDEKDAMIKQLLEKVL